MSMLAPPQAIAAAIDQRPRGVHLKTPMEWLSEEIRTRVLEPVMTSPTPRRTFEEKLPEYKNLHTLLTQAIRLEFKPRDIVKLYEKVMKDVEGTIKDSGLRSKFHKLYDIVYENDILLLSSLLYGDSASASEAHKTISSYPSFLGYLGLIERCSLVIVLVVYGASTSREKITRKFVDYGNTLAEELEAHVATLQVLLNPELSGLRKKLPDGEGSSHTKLRGSLLEITKTRI